MKDERDNDEKLFPAVVVVGIGSAKEVDWKDAVDDDVTLRGGGGKIGVIDPDGIGFVPSVRAAELDGVVLGVANGWGVDGSDCV